jgi:hypothetical protein
MFSIFRFLATGLILAFPLQSALAEPITRIWLTHPTSDGAQLMVNWETTTPGPSRVEFGSNEALEKTQEEDASVMLHHVSIPFPKSGTLHYRISSGTTKSDVHQVHSYSEDVLRVALAADWQGNPDLSALLADKPHLLIACGDLVPHLVSLDKPGDMNNTKPFSNVIDRYPRLFATVPFMPVLGNHDHQILPRFSAPPKNPVYDIDATAFLSFFPLPKDGWKWRFDVPGFDVRFVALDLNHITDFGTTWQSCHPFDKDSEQLDWYRDLMTQSKQRFVVTLYNEQNRQVRRQAGGAWGKLIQQGTMAITGFGLFAERSEFEGFPYFNTALKAGDIYEDKGHSEFLQATPNYILLTIPRGGDTLSIDIKGLDGTTLDKTSWKGR